MRSRVLLSEDALATLGLKSGQPCIVSWGSSLLGPEDSEQHSHSVVATAWPRRLRSSMGEKGGGGSSNTGTPSGSGTPSGRKSTAASAAAMAMAQVSAEISDCPSQVEVRALLTRPLPARRLVLEVGILSQDTLAYIAYSLSGSVVSKGTRVGVRLAGSLVVMQVLEVEPPGIVAITADSVVDSSASSSSSTAMASAPLAGVDSVFDEPLCLVTMALQRKNDVGKKRGGALIFGPSGVGKTHLAWHLAKAVQQLPDSATVVTLDPSTPNALLQIQRAAAIQGPTRQCKAGLT